MNIATKQVKTAVTLLIFLALVAVSCGDDSSSSVEESPDEATTDPSQDESTTVPQSTPEEESTPEESTQEESAQEDSAPEEEPSQASESDATGDPANTEPIKLGAISTLSGAASFPESHSAAQAVFDQVNASGGIVGRMIEYTVEDDGFDPALASQGARRLADEIGVVALVGSASVLECAVNAQFYTEVGLYSIQGTGIDPVCFATSNISPVNTGPFFSDTVALFYTSEELGADNVCFGAFDIPGFGPAYDAAVAEWTATTGKELAYSDTTLSFAGDLTPFMLELESNRCDAAVVQANDFHYVAMMQIREAQGLDVQIIGLTSGYSAAVAEQLGATGNGLILASEFEPFSDFDSAVLRDWRDLMEEAGVPQTSFAQGGYLAATTMVNVLKGIEGEITRESVAAALLDLEPFDTGLTGTPYAFGEGAAHGSNRAAKFVELVDGSWTVKTPEWIVVP